MRCFICEFSPRDNRRNLFFYNAHVNCEKHLQICPINFWHTFLQLFKLIDCPFFTTCHVWATGFSLYHYQRSTYKAQETRRCTFHDRYSLGIIRNGCQDKHLNIYSLLSCVLRLTCDVKIFCWENCKRSKVK